MITDPSLFYDKGSKDQKPKHRARAPRLAPPLLICEWLVNGTDDATTQDPTLHSAIGPGLFRGFRANAASAVLRRSALPRLSAQLAQPHQSEAF